MNINISFGGLFKPFTGGVSGLLSVVEGLLCLPPILSNLLNVATNLAATVKNLIAGVVAGITGLITGIVGEVVGTITGIIKSVLDLEATIKGMITGAISLILGILNQVDIIFKFTIDTQHCNFSAAELHKCVAASISKGISKRDAIDATNDKTGRTMQKLISKATTSLSQPCNIIERHVNKQISMGKKASAQINLSLHL